MLAAAQAAAPTAPRTLRLDYVHSGTATEEHFGLEGLALEGEWPGRLDRLLDDTNSGKYFFEVLDAKTGRPLYSRGFSSVYGEWETTPEATKLSRAFGESLRFPLPSGPVIVKLKKRDRRNVFRNVWSAPVDPASPAIDRSAPPPVKVWAVIENGPPRDKVDLLLLGDGYTAAEMDKWHADARRLVETLFAESPFKERRRDFNVWAIDTPALESGVSRPSDGVYRRSPIGVSYDAFGSARYVLAFDNRRIREIAAAAPYEFLEIVINGRKYGGGGIFNLYATVVSDNERTPYIFVHEFGHHFAGLADEYYTSEVAYTRTPERIDPWEPNVTADPKAAKWADLITPGTPLPTPWPKKEFEEAQRKYQAERRALRAAKRPEEEMEALFRHEQDLDMKLLGSAAHAGKVGAFEGANYETTGYYRPQIDCIMFSRDPVGFCKVCRRAIERAIALYAAPAPAAKPHPAAQKNCTACHTDEVKLTKAHAGQAIMKSACVRCHDVKAAASPYLISAHVHKPYAGRQCAGCHGPSPAPDCLSCHTTLKTRLENDGSTHNLLNKRNCTMCHDPHASVRPKLLNRPMNELCSSCHGSMPVGDFTH